MTSAKRRYVRKQSIPKGLSRVSAAQVDRNLANEVAKLKRAVRKRAPEDKYFDYAIAFANVADTAGASNIICQIPAGAGEAQRIGDSITVSAIDVLVRVGTTSASTGVAPAGEEAVRFAVVQDMQQITDAATVSPATVFAQVSNPLNPLLNIELGVKRFKVLWYSPVMQLSRIISSATPVATLTALSPTQANWAFAHLKCNIKVRYNGTSLTDVEKNGLYVLCWTNVAGDTVDADGFTRLTYTDS